MSESWKNDTALTSPPANKGEQYHNEQMKQADFETHETQALHVEHDDNNVQHKKQTHTPLEVHGSPETEILVSNTAPHNIHSSNMGEDSSPIRAIAPVEIVNKGIGSPAHPDELGQVEATLTVTVHKKENNMSELSPRLQLSSNANKQHDTNIQPNITLTVENLSTGEQEQREILPHRPHSPVEYSTREARKQENNSVETQTHPNEDPALEESGSFPIEPHTVVLHEPQQPADSDKKDTHQVSTESVQQVTPITVVEEQRNNSKQDKENLSSSKENDKSGSESVDINLSPNIQSIVEGLEEVTNIGKLEINDQVSTKQIEKDNEKHEEHNENVLETEPQMNPIESPIFMTTKSQDEVEQDNLKNENHNNTEDKVLSSHDFRHTTAGTQPQPTNNDNAEEKVRDDLLPLDIPEVDKIKSSNRENDSKDQRIFVGKGEEQVHEGKNKSKGELDNNDPRENTYLERVQENVIENTLEEQNSFEKHIQFQLAEHHNNTENTMVSETHPQAIIDVVDHNKQDDLEENKYRASNKGHEEDKPFKVNEQFNSNDITKVDISTRIDNVNKVTNFEQPIIEEIQDSINNETEKKEDKIQVEEEREEQPEELTGERNFNQQSLRDSETPRQNKQEMRTHSAEHETKENSLQQINNENKRESIITKVEETKENDHTIITLQDTQNEDKGKTEHQQGEQILHHNEQQFSKERDFGNSHIHEPSNPLPPVSVQHTTENQELPVCVDQNQQSKNEQEQQHKNILLEPLVIHNSNFEKNHVKEEEGIQKKNLSPIHPTRQMIVNAGNGVVKNGFQRVDSVADFESRSTVIGSGISLEVGDDRSRIDGELLDDPCCGVPLNFDLETDDRNLHDFEEPYMQGDITPSAAYADPCFSNEDPMVYLNIHDTECHKMSYLKIYEHFCNLYKVRRNSKICRTLAKGKEEFCTDGVINMRTNMLGDRGILPVFELLKRMPECHTFSIPTNGVRNEAVKQFVHFAKAHPNLARIDLSGNCITLSAANALMDLVRNNTRIIEIKLDRCRIGAEYQVQISKLLSKNQKK